MRLFFGRRSAAVLVLAVAAFSLEPAHPDESVLPGDAALDALMSDYWAYRLEADPVMATRAGVDTYNDRLPSVTPITLAERLGAERRFLARVADMDADRLSEGARLDAELLTWVLEDSIGALELDLARIPFNTFSGFYMDALTASDGVRMDSVEDYEDYLARLAEIPRFFNENIDNMRRGAETGFVLPRIVIDGVLPTLRAQVKTDAEDSPLFEPFTNLPASLPQADRERLRAAARRSLFNEVMPAFARVAEFLDNEYRASETIGATSLEGGDDYYAFQLRRYTTILGLTADEIHAIGLAEVARIREEMVAVIDEVGFDGDIAAFGEYMRNEPGFYADTADELLAAASHIAKRIDYVMPGFFGHLPRQPYGIVPVPAEIAPNYTTGAYYGSPLGGNRGGAYWVNTYALDQRPLYELPALTLHEAVPGHHHQSAVALEMRDVPAFRNDLYFSAFGEGWALYAERLGVEMGIYRDAYEHFGRLSYEMWRACRLVIDTGIHAMGWTREQAMQYLADNTSLSAGNIRAEVDRYISWPGQALAYKLGEIKIREMRRRAEDLLGDGFDLREFHDTLLENGALPMAMLEAVVERYIDRELEAAR